MPRPKKRTGPTVSAMNEALDQLKARAEITAVVIAVRVQISDHEWATEVRSDGDNAVFPQMIDDVTERLMPEVHEPEEEEA